ncbi:MAG: hypothetical protein K2N28_06080 [Muribaculaceae bacterium]|nr:hypothetical protein [Muribaculaceae bacterium]
MDKITKSLQIYLKMRGIKFKSMFNIDTPTRLEEQTSTVFHITRTIDKVKMSIVIDVYSKDNTVYLSAYPWFVFSDEKMEELKVFENKWNGVGMFSTLTIEEERGVIEPNKYCFRMTSRILSEENGLNHQLWKKYIELIIKESIDAWEMFDKIINPALFYSMQKLACEYGINDTFKAYNFN